MLPKNPMCIRLCARIGSLVDDVSKIFWGVGTRIGYFSGTIVNIGYINQTPCTRYLR